MAAYDPSYLETGSGQLTFRLLNLRANMMFVFFTGGLLLPTATAYSNIVTVANFNEPLEVRLSLPSEQGQMLVTWTTLNSTAPTLKWGVQSGVYPNSVAAQHTTTYTAADMCGPPATTIGYRAPGLFHTALFSELAAGELVYYVVGDASEGLWTAEFSFPAPPAIGSPVKIIAFGDLGQAPIDDSTEQDVIPASRNTTSAIAAVLGEGYQLITHIGDISYARG